MKLSQEELFMLSQIYGDGMDKKSVIRELSSIDEEGNFLKELIERIGSLSEKDFKVVFEEVVQSLNFNLEDVEKY